jgi:cell wall-associated NlpC family hydrolase
MLGEGRNSSVYMDYQASTPADPRVVEAMAAYWADQCGNPHATDHSVGWAADKAVEAARADRHAHPRGAGGDCVHVGRDGSKQPRRSWDCTRSSS